VVKAFEFVGFFHGEDVSGFGYYADLSGVSAVVGADVAFLG